MVEMWMVWFLAWMLASGWLYLAALQGMGRRRMSSRRRLTSIVGWTLFSAVAAEITRQSFIAYRPTFGLCAAVIIGLMLVGAGAGSLTASFISLHWSVSQSGVVAGIVGAWLAGWIEITLSYNPMSYVLPIAVIGAVFGTVATRIATKVHCVTFASDSEQV